MQPYTSCAFDYGWYLSPIHTQEDGMVILTHKAFVKLIHVFFDFVQTFRTNCDYRRAVLKNIHGARVWHKNNNSNITLFQTGRKTVPKRLHETDQERRRADRSEREDGRKQRGKSDLSWSIDYERFELISVTRRGVRCILLYCVPRFCFGSLICLPTTRPWTFWRNNENARARRTPFRRALRHTRAHTAGNARTRVDRNGAISNGKRTCNDNTV